MRFLITAANSSGSIALFEVDVPAGQRLAAPAHSHDHFEETIYGIAGILTWTVDGKSIDVVPGQALRIPRSAVHRFDNNGSENAKVLCAITPTALGPVATEIAVALRLLSASLLSIFPRSAGSVRF